MPITTESRLERAARDWAESAAIAIAIAVIGATAVVAEEAAEKAAETIIVHRNCDEGEDCRDRVVRKVVVGGEAKGPFEVGDGRYDHLMAMADGYHAGGFPLSRGAGGFLGVELVALTAELRAHFGAPEDAGVMIARVLPDSPAERAGLGVGDIVVAAAGENVRRPGDLARSVFTVEDGEALDLEVLRGGSIVTVTATVERREHPAMPRAMRLLHCGEGEDCLSELPILACGDDEDDCEVEVECKDGACSCIVNGVEQDCDG